LSTAFLLAGIEFLRSRWNDMSKDKFIGRREGHPMSEIDRAVCRKAAAECIELARITTDPETKQILLTRVQQWLKLAYSEHDSEFERLLAAFNNLQMGLGRQPLPHNHRMPMQQQEVQQQQSKAKGE
jgi:hypothetical protein